MYCIFAPVNNDTLKHTTMKTLNKVKSILVSITIALVYVAIIDLLTHPSQGTILLHFFK